MGFINSIGGDTRSIDPLFTHYISDIPNMVR